MMNYVTTYAEYRRQKMLWISDKVLSSRFFNVHSCCHIPFIYNAGMTTYNIWQMILQENRLKFLQKIEKWLLINTFKMLMQANLQISKRAGAIIFVDNCLCDIHIWRLFVDLVHHARGGVLLGKQWWGHVPRYAKSGPNFRRKNVISHTRFQTWP